MDGGDIKSGGAVQFTHAGVGISQGYNY